MDLDVRLGVNWIGEPGELRNPAEVRDEVLRDLSRASRTVHVLGVLAHTVNMANHGGMADTHVDHVVRSLLGELTEGQKVVDLDNNSCRLLRLLLFGCLFLCIQGP